MQSKGNQRALATNGEVSPNLARKYAATVKFIAETDQSVGRDLEAIGERIIRVFFRDDIERVLSRNPMKGFSMRALAEQPGMVLPFSTLHRCVALAVQKRQIGTVSPTRQLSTMHKVHMLMEKDVAKKKADIQLIQLNQLTADQYLERLRKRYPRPEHPGPTFPHLPTSFHRAEKSLKGLTALSIRRLKGQDRKHALGQLMQMRKYIDSVLDEFGA